MHCRGPVGCSARSGHAVGVYLQSLLLEEGAVNPTHGVETITT